MRRWELSLRTWRGFSTRLLGTGRVHDASGLYSMPIQRTSTDMRAHGRHLRPASDALVELTPYTLGTLSICST